MQATLNVEGMNCGHCVMKVEGALKNVGAEGKVDLAAKSVAVGYDENKLSIDKIVAAIEDKGYSVVKISQ